MNDLELIKWAKRGITLPEVIVVLVIISLAMIPLFQAMEFAMDIGERNNFYGQIPAVAQQKLESLLQEDSISNEGSSGFRAVDWAELPLEYKLTIEPVVISGQRRSSFTMDEITLTLKDDAGKQWVFVTRKERDE